MTLKSLQFKITVWAEACLLVTAIIIVAFSAMTLRQEALKTREQAIVQAKQLAEAVAQKHSEHIQTVLEVPLDAARTLAQTFSSVRRHNAKLKLERDDVNDILQTILERNPQFVGISTAWEPDAFDNMDRNYINTEGHDHTGRFIPYWSRNAEGAIMVEPLVDYDREGPGDYYQLPKNTKTEHLIEPYMYPIQGQEVLMTSLVAPIIANGTFYGMVGIDLRLDSLQALVDNVQELYDGSAQIRIITHSGTLAAVTGKPEMAGKHLSDLHQNWQAELEKVQRPETIAEENEGRLAVFTKMKIGQTATPWTVNILIPEERITAAADAQLDHSMQRLWKMVDLSLICLGAAFGILWFVSRSITRPLDQLVFAAHALSNGDFSRKFDIRQHDEIGKLAHAFQNMQETLEKVLQETGNVLNQIRRGRLDARGNPTPFRGNWQELVQGMNDVLNAFASPFNITARYLDRIAKGDLPSRITDHYEGDFAEVIENLNQCIDVIGGLADETETLAQAAIEGRFMARGDAGRFGGEYAKIVEGMNDVIKTLISHIDELPVMIMTLDRDFHIQYINNLGAELAGMPRGQLIGGLCFHHFHTDDCESEKCCSAKALQSGKRERSETVAHSEEGTKRYAEYSSLPIRNQHGETVGILETVMDQTETKQALAAVERQNWLRTGQAELGNVMRGELDVPTLAKNVIEYLAQYLNAEIGTLYVAQTSHGNTRLRLAGSYAYTRRHAGENIVKLGEGLVGQAAAEQEAVLYSDIPEDYLPIAADTGHKPPKHVLICPFLYQGTLKGVLEVGTSGEFSDQHLEFLKQASENIAVAIHSAQTRQQMQELLHKQT